jgi:hypothetical protein
MGAKIVALWAIGECLAAGALGQWARDGREGTLVRDRFDFDSPMGPLGRCVNALVLTSYMRKLLEARLSVIKDLAESPA